MLKRTSARNINDKLITIICGKLTIKELKIYLRLTPEDEKEFKQIQEYLGLKNDTEVLRFLITSYYREHQTEFFQVFLESFNIDDNGVKILERSHLDRKKKRIADIYFKPSGIFCNLCQSNDCIHIRFALEDPDNQQILNEKRKQGWKIPEPESLGRDLNPRPPPYQASTECVERPTEIDWEVYDDYLLKAYRPRTARERFSYGKNYADCLLTGNYSNLKVLSDDKRGHVLKALSALSKYLGKYEDFKLSIKQYGLKWTGKNKDDIIIDRLTKVHNADEIFDWIKLVKKERPELTDFMDLISITGMRLVEAVSCYNMIIQLGQEGKLNEYYNQEKMTLEHFHYKEAFIRKTKKVFISFVPHALIEKIIKDDPIPSTNAILKLLQRIGIRCRFGDIREANGSFLTKCLHEPEIDFLQGRVSASVFQQNYFNPSLIADLQTRALQGIAEIQTKIS